MEPETTRQLDKLSKKLGRLVGATALRKEAKKRGLQISKADVQAFVERISTKQVLAPGPESAGNSATTSATGEGSRWQADLVQYRFSADADADSDDDDTAKKYAPRDHQRV